MVDYWAVIKDEWSKVGVELEIDVKDTAVRRNILNQANYPGLTDGGVASDSAFHTTPTRTGMPSADANTIHLFDPKVDEWLKKIRMTILQSGMKAGMKEA